MHFTSTATLLIVHQLFTLGTLNSALSLTTLLRLFALDFNRLSSTHHKNTLDPPVQNRQTESPLPL